MKQIVLGTAGHIDHGKTSLIRALTGIETDRLKEEKRRGITIELGFAHLELPGGKLLGIVDVPGHEKFVKNMVAGATGIDMVALVIAADEGVMPQTREHLEICRLLEIRYGLVVFTKVDMVDSEWLELVREETADYLTGTFLAEAPVVEVSSVTGQGIEELKEAIDSLAAKIPEKDQGHIFRLPIDRVFSMKGFGTVVTGTCISGHIATGDEVSVYPQAVDSKVRGIQVHNREVSLAGPGLRTAINLQGLERATIERGNVLAGKGDLRPSYMVDVDLGLLESAPKKLKNRAKVRFHTGTSEIISTVILLDREELEPGSKCYAQIRMDEPTAVLRGDHFVIRSYSPVRTVGGGLILDALPRKRRRFSDASVTQMKTLAEGKLSEIVELFVMLQRFQGLEQRELPFLTNTGARKLEDPVKVLMAQRKILQYDRGSLIHAEHYAGARDEIVSVVKAYHRNFPLKGGIAKEELRSRTAGSRNPRLFAYVIQQLAREEILVLEKDTVRLAGHRVTLGEDQRKIRSELEEVYRTSGLQPPYFKELKTNFSGDSARQVLEVMVKDGVLVKVKEDLYFFSPAIERLEKELTVFLKEKGEITTPEFKDMTATSRKYTIPLIEYFDRTQLTVRVGDSRVLRKK